MLDEELRALAEKTLMRCRDAETDLVGPWDKDDVLLHLQKATMFCNRMRDDAPSLAHGVIDLLNAKDLTLVSWEVFVACVRRQLHAAVQFYDHDGEKDNEGVLDKICHALLASDDLREESGC